MLCAIGYNVFLALAAALFKDRSGSHFVLCGLLYAYKAGTHQSGKNYLIDLVCDNGHTEACRAHDAKSMCKIIIINNDDDDNCDKATKKRN